MPSHQPLRWFTNRRRRRAALALSAWLGLSLVLTGWPCCELFAAGWVPSPAGANDHHHSGDAAVPHAPEVPLDPCLTWLSDADLAFNAFADVLPSSPPGDEVWARAVRSVVASVTSRAVPLPRASGPPPSTHVPLYLSTARLRI